MAGTILVGTRKGSFRVEKVAGRWKVQLIGHAGAGVNYVDRDPRTGTLWAALGHGHWGAKLSRSRDGGATWEDAPQITYPEGARHLVPPPPSELGPGEGEPALKAATLTKLWVIAFSPTGRILVGTIPGGLFTSDNGGDSFELNRGLWNHESRGGDLFSGPGTGKTFWFGTPAAEGEFAPGIHSIVVDPKNPARWLIAISTAGVLETLDNGKTWRTRNVGLRNDYSPEPESEWAGHDPHCLVLCASQPNVLWQQNHFGIYVSTDGAATWRRVSQPGQPVHFGFPVAVDASDPKTAWFVPGKADMQRMAIDGALFVGRTRDGGQSFDILRSGLPQENAFDVIYRHALGNQGDLLAFGSTTGNLYLSESRGDHWQEAAHNLPPIYSVRVV